MDILFVSKPVEPPWNDSSKNLVRDLATAMTRHTPLVMGRSRGRFSLPRGRVEAVYAQGTGGFSPALADQVRVLSRLLAGRRADVWHFFFAPNPKSARAGRMAARTRSVPSVQTVCSAPLEGEDLRASLFTDRVVVLSRHTERRLLDAGVAAARVRRIPPSIGAISPLAADHAETARARLGLPTGAFVVTFPGDLEFGGGAAAAVRAVSALGTDAVLALACREKTPRARSAAKTTRELVEQVGMSRRTHWFGETPSIHALLGVSDAVILPSETLYAKMDYPLVLLEAMSMERPAIVARGTAAEELAEHGALASEAHPDAVTETLRKLMDDTEHRLATGRAGRRAVLERFSPAAMSVAYEALYDELSR